ncbi:MAG: glycosyltransferase family 2 protein [Deltaproteobacteria bacterium]|nr:glycosyltransferase family 2 protein [Deltaproteobacteria bacterium]
MYVLDADAQVRPDTLKRLWAHIDGDDVAAAQGGMIPAGPPESFAAFYVAIESLVHQRITLRGAARIGMTQSLLGSNTLIRRKVLEEAGGFPEKTRLEDIELSIALQNEGRRIAFTPEAHSTIVASPRVKHAMVQHRAWSREFMSIASRWLWRILEGSGSLPRRIDRLIFAMGYADRIVLLVYLLCAIAGGIAGRAFAPWSFIVLVLALPAIQAPLALWLGRGVATEYAYLAFLPVGFAIEMATHLDAFRQALLGRRPEWTRTVRGSSPRD